MPTYLNREGKEQDNLVEDIKGQDKLPRKAQKFCNICTMAGSVIRVWYNLFLHSEALRACSFVLWAPQLTRCEMGSTREATLSIEQVEGGPEQ